MKGLQVTKKVRKKILSYTKGTKLRKRYDFTRKVRSYEKGMKLRKSTKLRKKYDVTKKKYDVTNMVRSYEKKVRRCYEISYERPWLK